jgi:ketosteroid isomerase-like protein
VAATEPRQLIDLFATYFNSGDIDGLATLYEEKDVVFVRADGQPVEGKVEVLQFLRRFAGTARYTAIDGAVHIAGDVALLAIKWTMEGPNATLSGISSDVARRQSDRTWKFVIDSPWGSAVLPR